MRSRRLIFLALLTVLLLSKLLLSIFIFQEPKRAFVNDEYGYEDLALTILHDHSYTPRDDPGLGLIRPPGYPLLVAAVYSVAGQVPGAVILVQLIMGALTSLVIYRIGERMFSESAGILAALVFALSPQATVVSLYLLTDTLFTLFLSTSFYCLVRYLQDSRNSWIFLSGLLFGMLAMVRPVAFYLFIIWIVFIIASKPRLSRFTQAWKPALLFAVGFFMLVFPWMWRNYGLSGRVIFTTADAQNMFCCYAPAALAADNNISIAQARREIDPTFEGSLNRVDTQRLFQAADAATQVLIQHPIGYAKAHIQGLLTTMFYLPYEQWMRIIGIPYTGSGALEKLLRLDFRGAIENLAERASVAGWIIGITFLIPIASLLYTIANYLLAIFQGYGTLRYPHGSLLTLLTLMCVVTILYLLNLPGPLGGMRFRVPAEPFISVLAAQGLLEILRRRQVRAAPLN